MLKLTVTDFFDIIKAIEMECCGYPEMKIVDGLKLMTSKNIMIITDKPCNFRNESSKNIYYWQLTSSNSKDIVKNNICGVFVYKGNIYTLKKHNDRRIKVIVAILDASSELKTITFSTSWKTGFIIFSLIAIILIFATTPSDSFNFTHYDYEYL